MGRDVKRVPLDFNWPLNEIWKGYINPYSPTKCKLCDGQGVNPETLKISKAFYDFEHLGKRWCNKITEDEVDALFKEHRLFNFKEKPTAEEVNLHENHDAINRWILIETRAKRLGVWGYCPLCEGTGSYFCEEKYHDLHENWEQIEPPEGEGYQLWETVSEGSPISPVFVSLDDLASWCENGATCFASQKTPREKWLKMFQSGDFSYKIKAGNATLIMM
jgi:hypothetical protein